MCMARAWHVRGMCMGWVNYGTSAVSLESAVGVLHAHTLSLSAPPFIPSTNPLTFSSRTLVVCAGALVLLVVLLLDFAERLL